ncbi:MAG: hypothetical protein EOO24_21540 [Comamonadaceae bacterium]|nr:MAG: hypothetical protein EOO24_21540 [Comamonadaceae bacterium]
MSDRPPTRAGLARPALVAVLALLALNGLLTLVNPGPMPWPRPDLRVAPELCALVLLAAGLSAWRSAMPRGALRMLAALTTAALLVRGVEITSIALFGRSLNLYWDGRHLGEVLKMTGTSLWIAGGGALAGLAVVVLIWRFVCACWFAVGRGLADAPVRRGLAATAGVLLAVFALHDVAGLDTRRAFATAATPVVLRQAELLAGQWHADTAASRLPASPAFDTGLGALKGGDVLLVFAESYGVSTLDDPRQAAALAGPRAALADALAARGAAVVSARVRSPTFGGGSWLAHGALLTGLDTQNPLDYDVLLTTARPSLPKHFSAHGWRSIGWMPGLQRPWPEGSFFGFDRIVTADTMGYQGMPFGSWRIPDQAAMALLDAQELARGAAPRAPRFVVFPTVTSHAPFRPVAPYVADWDRLAGPAPYSAAQRAHALDEPVTWRDPVPAYLQSVAYTWQWLGAYLRDRAPSGLLTIVIGDHQPWATVSGPGASWDVPVHVIGTDAALLRRFEAAGFRPGLAPAGPPIGAMHELTAVLLRAFDAAP